MSKWDILLAKRKISAIDGNVDDDRILVKGFCFSDH